jgi:hypothetical protein
MISYAWAASYSAGSDAFVYRRYAGELPEYAKPFARAVPAHVAAFCEAHGVDVAVDDELVPGRVRRVRTDAWSDETP